MIPKISPEPSGAIRARLTYLRNRKAALDELILSFERYAEYALPHNGRAPRMQPIPISKWEKPRPSRLAGAA
jgi:hypothetical protein